MPTLLDYLIAIPLSILWWWHGFTSDKCKLSPDKRHSLPIVKDGVVRCKYCGMLPDRKAPGANGKDR